MKILHVIAGLHRIGGTTTFVGGLASALVKLGNEVTIASYQRFNSGIDYALDPKICAVRIGDARLRENDFDIVHVHGLWDREVLWGSRVAFKNNIPLVWSPHGMLAPWALRHRWWKKMIPWRLFIKRRLKRATAIHVTSEAESKWVRDLGLEPKIIVPMGVDMIDKFSQIPLFTGSLRVLFVGRIHPVKGLENLIEAASFLPLSRIHFRIVGSGLERYQSDLKRLAFKLGVAEAFTFVGAKFNEELDKEFNDCDLLVLPSYSENFGSVVIEALTRGRPVMASWKTPWKELEEQGCGWWVDNSPRKLADALSKVITMSDADHSVLRLMGNKGRHLVAGKYSWMAIGRCMACKYMSIMKDEDAY